MTDESEEGVGTNSVKTSAERCVDTIFDIITVRHKIVLDLRETSRRVDELATNSRANKIMGIGVIIFSPHTFTLTLAAILALILGATVLDTLFDEEYKKEMKKKIEKDKTRLCEFNTQLHDFNINLQAYTSHTSLSGIPEDVNKFVIEPVRLAGLHVPEDFERKIDSLKDIGSCISAVFVVIYKGDCGMLSEEMRSIAKVVDGHFPDLNELEEGLRKISRQL